MTANHSRPANPKQDGLAWGVLFTVGLVLLVVHRSGWASAWVTTATIFFVLLVMSSALRSVLNRRRETRTGPVERRAFRDQGP